MRNMYNAISAASIRYSGQWLLRLANAFKEGFPPDIVSGPGLSAPIALLSSGTGRLSGSDCLLSAECPGCSVKGTSHTRFTQLPHMRCSFPQLASTNLHPMKRAVRNILILCQDRLFLAIFLDKQS